MKVYDVYYQWGVATVKAERVERLSTNDKPTKILFFVGDEIVAEFFCENTAGWVDRGEE